MIATFLRGKAAWERGETADGLAALRAILGGADTLYVPERILPGRADLPYELFVGGMLASDDHLLIDFATAIARLWDAFPAQYAVEALELRRLTSGDVGPRELEWLYAAAAQGLVSTDGADYDRVALVVVRAADHPRLAAVLDASRLPPRSEAARAAFVAEHRDLVANLFLNAVFHRWAVMDAAAALSGLDRVAASDPELLGLVAETLTAWPSADDEVARLGMRAASGSPACVTALVRALRTRDFDSLGEDCLPRR